MTLKTLSLSLQENTEDFSTLSYLTLTLEQADIYFKYKGKKPLTEAEQILFTTAKDYLKGVMNGKTTIPTRTWKEEYSNPAGYGAITDKAAG